VRTLANAIAAAGADTFRSDWNAIRRAGIPHVALDAQAPGFRYLSLNALILSSPEARRLAHLTTSFGRLLDLATDRLLEDRDAWSELAWPWPALELARQEPRHPGSLATLYGRFDWLLDADGQWQLVEYNADTPSGGREVAGFEPTGLQIARAYEPGLQSLYQGLPSLLTRSLLERLAAYRSTRGRRPQRVGIVSSHSWLEDMAQAAWLDQLLTAAGQAAIVGDITDLEWRTGDIRLRGERIDALYRFYPIERLYRHALFAPLLEAAIEGRLMMLNGLRGFLAQSKATLAWLWLHRCSPELGAHARELIERHLPASLPARHPQATAPGGGQACQRA
jgi:glutathionylspermidine synthase